MFGKCDRQGCIFRFDDAEHMDDAIAKLRAHYRTEHRTKAFYEDGHLANTETLNFTLDEAMMQFCGHRWRENLANGQLNARNLIHACQQIVRRHHRYNEGAVQEAIALAGEHGQALAIEEAPVEVEVFDDLAFDPEY